MSDFEMLVQASRLYYELGETQERIAEILGVTRSQVSRILKEARAEGIVEIRVIDGHVRDTTHADRLRTRFGLKGVHLVPRLAGPEDLTRRLMGRAAATVFRDFLRDGLVVGVGNGAAVAATVDAIPDGVVRVAATIVPLSGGGMTPTARDPVRRLADAIGGYAHELPAPGLVREPVARDAILSHLGVQNVARLWQQLDIALFGIGADIRSEVWFGPEVLRELEEADAVGEVLIAPFDLDGRFISPTLAKRTIGFDARELPRVPVRIGVAGGDRKVRPILGALRAGAVSVLVTDDDTARDVLELDDKTGGRARSGTRPR